MANFLWKGANKTTGFHLTKWKNIAIPKEFGGWGIRNIFWIAKSLASKILLERVIWEQSMESNSQKQIPKRTRLVFLDP
jgi:hypothetical protein